MSRAARESARARICPDEPGHTALLLWRAALLLGSVVTIPVIAFGAVFGPLGAFLALPMAATIQAAATTYVRRHELVDSAMLTEPEPAARRTRWSARSLSRRDRRTADH